MVITATFRAGLFDTREFMLTGAEFESALDALNAIIQAGNTLLEATWVEKGQAPIRLPVETFDGAPVREALLHLKSEWETALASGPETSDRRNRYLQRLERQAKLLKAALVRMEAHRARVQHLRHPCVQEACRISLENRIQSQKRAIVALERLQQWAGVSKPDRLWQSFAGEK